MGKIEENAQVLISDLDSQIVKVDEVKAGLEQKKVLVQEMVSESSAAVLQARTEGIEEGRNSIVLPDPENPDAQYTQAAMDEAVSTREQQVRDEMQPQIDASAKQVESLNSELEMVKMDQQSLQGQVDQLKADIEAENVSDEEAKAAISERLGSMK